MTLDGILSPYKKCKKYSLSADVAEYLKYIGEKPFYIAPSFSDVKTDPKLSSLKPKFVLLSAPGAAGKSALARMDTQLMNTAFSDFCEWLQNNN